MSHPAHNTSLSLPSRLLFYLGPPSAILLTSIASPQTALLSPLAFLPSAWLLHKWRESNAINPRRRGELEPMIWIYAATGTVGLASAALVQLVAALAVTTVLFGTGKARGDYLREAQRSTINGLTAEQLANRANLAFTWQNWVFIFGFSFAMAGVVEEALKYLPIAYARRRGTADQRQPRNRAYLDYALAGALSFGVLESITFLYSSCEKGQENWPKLALTLFERIIFGSAAHALTASLTALRAIRRDYYGDHLTWWDVVGPSVCLHGAFDFVAFAFSALEGNVGWIHPSHGSNISAMLGLCGGLVATAAWWVRREWKAVELYEQQRK